MNKEKELIKLISKSMPKSDLQLNKIFESDSEILDYKGNKLLFNIDEFSEEDMLRDNDPFLLGWNLAVGAISDILATGGKPLFYAHSMVVNKKWTEEYIKLFSEGVAACLRETGAAFIGGDFGKAQEWRYTASVIGELEGKPLYRSGALEGDLIYISGKIGSGNFEAGLKLYSKKSLIKTMTAKVKNRFELRLNEARLIKEFSKCCIDTSDGTINALNCISEMSNTGYEITNLPYIKSGLLLSKLLSIPKTLLFLGESGEYELLFTISKECENDFLKEAHDRELLFYKLGVVANENKKTLIEDNKIIDLINFNIRARDFEDVKVYLNKLISFVSKGGE